MKPTLVAMTTCALLAACSSAPEKKADAVPAPARQAAAAQPKPAAAVESEAQRLARVIAAMSAKSIYFDYDQYAVQTKSQDTIKKDSELLVSAPQMSVRLEGNADERGSTEYNLALGQKRAEAVRRALTVMGVPDTRLEAISYGKERPRAQCHEEKCWAENRRVDFVAKKAESGK